MKYNQVEAGEWVRPRRNGYKMACCDCGLVHKLEFRILGNKRRYVVFRAERDNRATGQIRRHKEE